MSAAWVRDPLKNINKQETGTSMTGWAAQWWQQSGGTEENTAVLIGAVLKQAAHYLHNRALKDRRTDLAKSLREGLAQCEGDCTTSACMDGVQAKDLACSSTQNCKIKMGEKSLMEIWSTFFGRWGAACLKWTCSRLSQFILRPSVASQSNEVGMDSAKEEEEEERTLIDITPKG